MIIYLDFDGTVVEHAYPKIGREVPHALRVIKRLQEAGHEIILNTMRCEIDDKELKAALEYLNEHYKVELEPIQTTAIKLHPYWDLSREDELFIDDTANGIPLIPAVYDGGSMVDWLQVEIQLMEHKIL